MLSIYNIILLLGNDSSRLCDFWSMICDCVFLCCPLLLTESITLWADVGWMGGECECLLLTSIASITASNIYPNSRLHLSKTREKLAFIRTLLNQTPYFEFVVLLVWSNGFIREGKGDLRVKYIYFIGRNGKPRKYRHTVKIDVVYRDVSFDGDHNTTEISLKAVM